MCVSIIFHAPGYLLAHPLADGYLTTLEDISQRDYKGTSYFRGVNVPSIDLDRYEIDNAVDRDCTSDGVIGIADLRDSDLRNHRLLLVELRMGYSGPQNLSYSSISEKYRHSCEILREGSPDMTIDTRFALIFSDRTVAKCRSWISRWSKEKSKKEACNWCSYSPEGFLSHINFGKHIPLRPSSETVSKCDKWSGKRVFSDYHEFELIAEEIKNAYVDVKIHHKVKDEEFISEFVTDYFTSLSFPVGEEGEYCRMLRDEILGVFQG